MALIQKQGFPRKSRDCRGLCPREIRNPKPEERNEQTTKDKTSSYFNKSGHQQIRSLSLSHTNAYVKEQKIDTWKNYNFRHIYQN